MTTTEQLQERVGTYEQAAESGNLDILSGPQAQQRELSLRPFTAPEESVIFIRFC